MNKICATISLFLLITTSELLISSQTVDIESPFAQVIEITPLRSSDQLIEAIPLVDTTATIVRSSNQMPISRASFENLHDAHQLITTEQSTPRPDARSSCHYHRCYCIVGFVGLVAAGMTLTFMYAPIPDVNDDFTP